MINVFNIYISAKSLTLFGLLSVITVCPSNLAAEEDVSKYEKYLADSAAHLGTDRLADDRSDANGQSLLSAALKLDPANERALLTVMMLKKELELKKVKHKFSPDTFVKRAIYRGKALYKTRDSYAGGTALSKLYFLLAELFTPADRTVLLYLAKLEKEGETKGLDQLLQSDDTALTWLSKKEQEAEAEGNDQKPVHFWGVNEPMAELTKLYGKSTRTKYAPRSNGTLKYFKTPFGQVEAFLSGGKCVRVQYQLAKREYSNSADQDNYVLSGRDDWKVVLEKPTIRGYENAVKTMAASITDNGMTLTFVAWSKTFYK